MILWTDNRFGQIGIRTFNLNQILVVQRFRPHERDPTVQAMSSLFRRVDLHAPIRELAQRGLNSFGQRCFGSMPTDLIRQRAVFGIDARIG